MMCPFVFCSERRYKQPSGTTALVTDFYWYDLWQRLRKRVRYLNRAIAVNFGPYALIAGRAGGDVYGLSQLIKNRDSLG